MASRHREVPNLKRKVPATRAYFTPCWHCGFRSRSNLHQGLAAIAPEHPTSNLQGASRLAIQQPADTLLEHAEMDNMDKMTVDRWRPKLATDLSAHVLTILGKVDQRVRTELSETIQLSTVV